MKRLLKPLVIVLVSALPAPAQVIIDITAEADGRNAVIEWSTGRESGVVDFSIQRSFDGRTFYTIARVEPLGDNHTYRFVDDDLFKEMLHTYYYRIEVAFSGGRSQFSPTVDVTLSFSGIHRTWGSIKAMFR